MNLNNYFSCIFTFYFLLKNTLVEGQSNGDLRLNFGHEGVLEIYYNGWGSVCSVGWDRKDSIVACRSLGFAIANTYRIFYYHPNYTQEFYLSNVNCSGNESNILECGYSMTFSSCFSYRHVYLDCSLDHCQSYLDIPDNSPQVVQYFNGQNWFYICKDNFSEENAHVICYENYRTEALNYSYVSNNTLTFGYSFYPYQYSCKGSEASLCNCPIVDQTCQSMEVVVIQCRKPDYGTIRLTNDANKFLETYINSRWIYVCIDVFKNEYNYVVYEAYINGLLPDTMDIACRELGYSKASSFRLNFENDYTEEFNLILGSCTNNDTKISNCADTNVRKNYCPSRITLSCEIESCNSYLQVYATSNRYQLAQIYTDKSWFYICPDNFTLSDANVMCKEIALANAISFNNVIFDNLSQQRPISPYKYYCAGSEDSICSCPAERSTCGSNEVANVLCDKPKFGAIRISYGYQGYIEVYNGEWRRVCDSTINSLEANIICRSAGYRRFKSYASVYFPYYYTYHLSIVKSIGFIHCFGNEANLLDCSYNNYTRCSSINFVTCEKDGCETFLNNPESNEAVQIYNNQQWYSLCKDKFTQQTADIICRENHGSNASQYSFQTLQSINYPIYPFYLNCDGNENSICACDAISQTCSSNQIVYVECNGPGNGSLRLSNGTSGILEVYLNGWKRVCGTYLNQAISNVVCRSLGYRDAVTFSPNYYGYYKYSRADFRCLGNEMNILECQYSFKRCTYSSYISCRTEGCQSYISEEHTTNEPVKIYTNEDWYYLCANFISTKEANVICRENGFLNGAESIMSMLRSQLSISFEIYPYNINCQGDESSLCDCSMIQSQCQDNNIAMIKCSAPDQGTLRYSDQYRNLIEIYYNGGWSHICYNDWGHTDSDVACRQLGYTISNGYSGTSTTQIATSFPNTFGNVACNGNESSLIECSYSIAPCQPYYYSYYTYMVLLYCTRGDCEVHAPFATEQFQIVEYFADQQRYYLCADGFTKENADVVCRETSSTLSITHRGVSELNLPPSTQIYPLQHSCFGNEPSLCNCSTFRQLCTTGSAVEVQCGTPALGTIRSTSIGKYLEVYSNGWKYICGSSFNGQKATVACRQQGFRTYRNWASKNSNGGTYWNRNLNCRGNETKLLDCSYTSISNCNRKLRLYCEIDNCDSILINGNQTPVPVRYYDGHAKYYLCKEGFTLETANVVCHREGYGDVMTIGETQPSNTGLNYAILNRVYTCNGNEISLCNCSYSIQRCESGSIVELQCKKTEQGAIRLSAQNTLQLYYNQWTDICYRRWDTSDSDVACRQLGFIYANSSIEYNYYYNYYYYYYYYLDNFVSDVICIGNETKLTECRYHLTKNCESNTGVSITCYPGGCQSYAPDAASFPQIVRYYTKGWYYLCVDGFTAENADVVCRENEGTLALSYTNTSYSESTADLKILEKKFGCQGRENSLCDCTSSTSSCLSNSVVKLQCNPPVYGHIRLSNREKGVLEIYLNRWGYVCDDGWNKAASEVVCSQLGVEPLISFKTGVKVNNILYPFLLDDVKCYGNESSLFECSHTLRHDCSSGEHVSITCGFNGTSLSSKNAIEQIAFYFISYLIVGISFVSLLLSLILFIAAGKPFFKVEANIIYFNYCLSMLFATGLFIFGIQVGTYNPVLCKIIAFLLHYSWLAVFTWTLCIGILVMYKIVISVLSTRKIYIYLILFGWIFPIIIPIITIAITITRDDYVDSNSHCFLNIAGGVIWSFIAPIFIIIIINAVFLIISLIRIIQTKSANQNEETRDIIKSALITGLVLTPVLGLPWLFLLFNIAIRHSALEWIFIIINGLMGLIFLLVVVIRNKEVVALFKKNKETASTNTHPSPRHAVSSSATGSTFTSNRFKETNTLERQLVKESEIETATIEPYEVHNSPYSTAENIYDVDSEEKKAYEAGMSEQTLTGYENPFYSSISDVPDDPPGYQNLSKMEMVTEVHTNPMYMQSPVPVQDNTNELYADVTELNESNAVYSNETQHVDD